MNLVFKWKTLGIAALLFGSMAVLSGCEDIGNAISGAGQNSTEQPTEGCGIIIESQEDIEGVEINCDTSTNDNSVEEAPAE